MTAPAAPPPPPAAPLASVRPAPHRLPMIDEGATPSRTWRWQLYAATALAVIDGRIGDTVPAVSL